MGIESICENFYLSTMDESFYRNHWISINVIFNEIGNEIGNETKKRNFSLLEKTRLGKNSNMTNLTWTKYGEGFRVTDEGNGHVRRRD